MYLRSFSGNFSNMFYQFQIGAYAQKQKINDNNFINKNISSKLGSWLYGTQ